MIRQRGRGGGPRTPVRGIMAALALLGALLVGTGPAQAQTDSVVSIIPNGSGAEAGLAVARQGGLRRRSAPDLRRVKLLHRRRRFVRGPRRQSQPRVGDDDRFPVVADRSGDGRDDGDSARQEPVGSGLAVLPGDGPVPVGPKLGTRPGSPGPDEPQQSSPARSPTTAATCAAAAAPPASREVQPGPVPDDRGEADAVPEKSRMPFAPPARPRRYACRDR